MRRVVGRMEDGRWKMEEGELSKGKESKERKERKMKNQGVEVEEVTFVTSAGTLYFFYVSIVCCYCGKV